MINGLFRVKALQPLPSHESLSTLAETFSNYFHSKIEKMRSELEQSEYITSDLLINEQPSICQSSFLEFNQVSECFVSELIIKAPGKSCTLDPVPAAILKRNVELLSAAIATIINTSLASGVFPKALKHGLVRPSINKHPIINTSLASAVFPKALKHGLVRPSINKHPIINTSLASGVFPKALKHGLVRPSINKHPIINTSLASGVFPKALKHGLVCPSINKHPIINTSLASGVFPKALKQGLVRPSINKHPIINTSLASGVFPKALKQGLVRPSINKHPIINTSLASGVFPKALKQGLVRPSIKKPTLDKEAYSSYRPITNTAFVSKLLERVAFTQFMSYVTEHELIAKFQSAYRRFHSTETSMVRVLNDILLTIDSRQVAVLVLLDMSSAFDTIDSSLLLQRLSDRYGVGGTAMSWLESYLTDRTQSVTVGNVTSAPQRLINGVPQGSVLGPLLLALYFAPLEDIIKAHGLDVMVYADDVQLYISINPIDGQSLSSSKIEACVKDILIWCTKNMLSCNPSKTKILQLLSRFSRTDSPPTPLLIGRDMIVPVSVARDLGITLDKHLTLHQHINNVRKSGSYAIRINRNIGRIHKYLNNEDCEKLVHAFVTSRLDCCNSILYGLPGSELAKLQRIQNIAARLVARVKKSDHITPVFQKLHWLPVKSRIIYKILLLTYKALNGLAPSYLSELLDTYRPSRNLRSSGKHLLTTKKTNTVNCGDRAFSVCAPKLWNNLPLHIRQAKSLSSFKSQLKTHLLKIVSLIIFKF